MKDWIFGRKLMEEQQGNGGEGGGGGGTGGGEGGAGDDKGDQGGEGDQPGEQHVNALGEEANKGGEQQANKEGDPSGSSAAKPKGSESDPNAPTEEELKAYGEAKKLDETEFGKEAQLAPAYAERLPAFFKKHGVGADKVNAMTRDFVRLQKEIDKDAIAKEKARIDELNDLTDKRNKEYFEKYDAPARERIVDGFKWCFPEGSIFREILSIGPAGMDPDILRICQFVGERLPKDKAPGAAAGAGSGGSKSISDSFMGL